MTFFLIAMLVYVINLLVRIWFYWNRSGFIFIFIVKNEVLKVNIADGSNLSQLKWSFFIVANAFEL